MTDILLNILSLGTKPLYERQLRFHNTITEFRNKLSRLEEVSLTEVDIDTFYNKLNNFDFSFIFFSEYYQKYIANLNRFKPQAKDENIDLTFLMIALAEDKWKPTKPFPIFFYHLRYKYKLTSRFFLSHQKKKNRKKLNPPELIDKQKSKFKSSQNWTRVPLGKSECKPGCGCSK